MKGRLPLPAVQKGDSRPLLFALAGGVMLGLACPKFDLGFMAWAALAPVVYSALKARTAWLAAFYAWFAGFVFYLITLYWIYIAANGGGLPAPVAVAALLMLCVLMALEWALFGWYVFLFKKAGPAWFPVAAAAGFATVEWIRILLCKYATWFAWFMLGYTQWQYPSVLQLVSFTGVHGLAFLIVWWGAALAWAVADARPWTQKWKPLAVPLVVAVACLVYGGWQLRLNSPDAKPQSTVRVAVLQPNIDQYNKWDPAQAPLIEEVLKRQLEQVRAGKPHFVVWPEASLPDWIEHRDYKVWLSSTAVRTQAYQLVGAISERDRKSYVSAFLFAPDGSIAGIYDKRQLVPFGEYVPFRGALTGLVPLLSVMGEFTPGRRDQPLLAVDGMKFGSIICYETMFSYLWRESAAYGARFAISTTNDAWYLDSAGPRQHFAVNAIRAAETRMPVARAANTGVSGWVDHMGRVRMASPLMKEFTAVFDLPVPPDSGNTFYVRHGDLFSLICAGVFAVFLVACILF